MGHAGPPHSITHRGLPSSAPARAPSNLWESRTEDSGFSPDMASVPSLLTGPWGGSGGCIHPAGVAPCTPSCSRIQSQTRVLQGAPAVQSWPDLLVGACRGRSHPLWDVRLWELGLRCSAGLLLTLGCQELGIMTSGTRVQSEHRRNPDGPWLLRSKCPCPQWLATDDTVISHTHTAQMYAAVPKH